MWQLCHVLIFSGHYVHFPIVLDPITVLIGRYVPSILLKIPFDNAYTVIQIHMRLDIRQDWDFLNFGNNGNIGNKGNNEFSHQRCPKFKIDIILDFLFW